MKFSCDRDTLVHEISIAQEIISSRNALSILSNVLLEVKDKNLTIRATDLKVSFETAMQVDSGQDGITTVFCDKFLGILRSLPQGDLEVELIDNEALEIRPLFKKIDFRLKSIPADKFPAIQKASESDFFEISQKDLLEMVSQTIFAVSDDETRYFMNGVFLEKNDNTLNMVATDGRRLSYISKGLEAEMSDFQGIIIPPKILNLLRKLSSGEGVLSLAVTDKNIFFVIDKQNISSSLIEGQFPNYRRVIPEEQEHELTIQREGLIEAIKRVSLLVEQKSRRVYMNLSEGTMELSSEESDIGLAKEELACTYSGPDIKIALNYLYLLDPLRVIDSEEVQIQFTESNKAISLLSVPEQDFFHIIMPMQLD